MKIRIANLSDCKDILEWRSDNISRKMFKNQELISWEDHFQWFTDSLKNEKCLIYIGYLSEFIKIGVVRFNINQIEECATVSLNINPKFRNLGFGTRLLETSILEFNSHYNLTLLAEVKIQNIPSIKCFNKAGFKEIKQNGKFLILRKN